MKISILFIILFAVLSLSSSKAQYWQPEKVIFFSQQALENFKNDYPKGKLILNTVNRSGSDILSLQTLSNTEQNQGKILFNKSKHRIGFVMGYGGQSVDQLLSDINERDAEIIRKFLISQGIKPEDFCLKVRYNYQVKFFQAQYYWAFLRKQTWGLDFLLQPQYNLTKYRHVDNVPNETKGFEFGVNAGVLVRKHVIKDFFSLYTFISSGPHYVSGTPQRQSKGFVFSSNLFVGLNIKLYENIYLDLKPGFRHISNAGMKGTNGGINDLVLSGGILVNLQNKTADNHYE